MSGRILTTKEWSSIVRDWRWNRVESSKVDSLATRFMNNYQEHWKVHQVLNEIGGKNQRLGLKFGLSTMLLAMLVAGIALGNYFIVTNRKVMPIIGGAAVLELFLMGCSGALVYNCYRPYKLDRNKREKGEVATHLKMFLEDTAIFSDLQRNIQKGKEGVLKQQQECQQFLDSLSEQTARYAQEGFAPATTQAETTARKNKEHYRKWVAEYEEMAAALEATKESVNAYLAALKSSTDSPKLITQ